MAGEALGYIACGCGLPAAIKKVKNSENLYSHCTKCGCDRRTGEHVQEKFRAAVGVMELPDISGNISGSETEAAPQTAQGSREWAPSPETHRKAAESDPETIPENSGKGLGRKITAGLVFTLSAAGLLYKTLRG